MILGARTKRGPFGLVFGVVLGQAVFKDHIAGAVVPVTRLSHRADVDQQLTLAQAVFQVDLIGREELKTLGEDAGDMGMPLKTVSPNKLEQSFHFAMIVDILGKNIFAQRVARRAVDEQVQAQSDGSAAVHPGIPSAARC